MDYSFEEFRKIFGEEIYEELVDCGEVEIGDEEIDGVKVTEEAWIDDDIVKVRYITANSDQYHDTFEEAAEFEIEFREQQEKDYWADLRYLERMWVESR